MYWSRLGDHFKVLPPTLTLLLLILAVALALRLYGIGWDHGFGFHPDERSIYMRSDCMFRVLTEAPGYGECIREHPETEPGIPGPGTFFDADKSPLNPYWFPLGSLLMYLIVGIRAIFEPFMDLGSLMSMAYIGRSIAAVADVGSVFMVYLLGKRVWGSRVGLLAAALVSLAVVHIQISHFYRPEPLLVFFLLTSFWFMLQVMDRHRARDSILLGVFVGLSFAMKVSVLPMVLPLALVYAYWLFGDAGGRWRLPSLHLGGHVARHALLGVGAAVAVFAVATPYAFLDIGSFASDIEYQARQVARTAGKVPFTVQYVDSTPFLYELRQSAVWGLGLPLGIVAWGGLLFAIARVFQAGPARRVELLFLLWIVPNVLLLSVFGTKFLRYIFPVMPFMVLLGSAMLFWAIDRARTLPLPQAPPGDWGAAAQQLLVRHAPLMVVGAVVLVVAATGFYALAFERVYARDHPAIQASDWINKNVPVGHTIVTDNHWDEGIPDIHRYRVRQIPIYARDTRTKMDTIAGRLSEGDYLVFYSNRTYGSVARVPDIYPLSARYYRLLFSGELGYEPVRAFTSYPQLFGVAFVDDTFGRAGLPEPEALAFNSPPISLHLGYADENVINYDHPKVLLFKKTEEIDRTRLFEMLTAEQARPPPGLMLSPEDREAQREGGTWTDIISRASWTNVVPVLAWLLLVELVYLAALPLATFLFRPLPDRGIVLARLLGILGVAYVAWLLASTHVMGFSRGSVFVGVLVVAALSSLVLCAQWRQFKEFVVRNWRLLAVGEVLFLVAFLAFVEIRAANPDLWHFYRGGEKPMDFAYLNAVLRSTYMPPYDPWFAGGYLNYYYWGQFIVATLIKGTGIVPSVAYNLAVPLMFAFTVTGAYSLVYNLTAAIRRSGSSGGPDAPPRRDVQVRTGERASFLDSLKTGWRWTAMGVAWGPVGAGLTAGLFVAVMGNLDGLVQLIQGGWNSTIGNESFPAFDFWRSSRMIPVLNDVTPSALTFWVPDKGNPAPELGYHITEFPFFTFLFADLHAHMMVIPFTLLSLGFAFSLVAGMKGSSRRWLGAVVLGLGVTVGSLWAINSWDFPTYLILVGLFMAAGVYLGRGTLLRRFGIFLALAVGVALLSVLAFLPFHANYHPYPTGLDVSKWQTPVHNFLGIHGLFLFLLVTFLAYLARVRLKEYVWAVLGRTSRPQVSLSSALVVARAAPWAVAVVALVGFIAIYLAAAGYWTAAILTVLLGLTLWATKNALLRREGGDPLYSALPLIMIAFALLIAIGVEFVRAKDDIGRMNTLFKYYLEVWVLLAMGAAYILWYIASRGTFRIRGMSLLRGAWLGMLAILVAASFIFPILGTRSRIADRFSTEVVTLDGADFMSTAVHWQDGERLKLVWDHQAILWLQDNVQGSPVVLEAHDEQYTWSSRISNYTGLPTVLGWSWHQTQQRMRYDYAVQQRSSVVQEIYSTRNLELALELLRQYEVEYVVVGELERLHYPELGLGKFDSMSEDGLARLVYQNEGVKVYQGLWYN